MIRSFKNCAIIQHVPAKGFCSPCSSEDYFVLFTAPVYIVYTCSVCYSTTVVLIISSIVAIIVRVAPILFWYTTVSKIVFYWLLPNSILLAYLLTVFQQIIMKCYLTNFNNIIIYQWLLYCTKRVGPRLYNFGCRCNAAPPLRRRESTLYPKFYVF